MADLPPSRHRSAPTILFRLSIGALIVLAGCSGGDSVAVAPTATTAGNTEAGNTTVSTVAETSDTPTAAVEAPDACEVLTPEEVAAVLDPAARAPVEVTLTENRGLHRCHYKLSNDYVGSEFLYLHVEPAAHPLGDRLDQARQDAGDAELETVSGIGDEAFFFGDDFGGKELWIRSGDLAAAVITGGFEEYVGLDRSAMEELARRLVEALG